MTTSTVSSMSEKGASAQAGLIVDSLHVTSVRIFLKDLKLHRSSDDTLKETLGGEVKTGAFVAQFDATGSKLISTSMVPVGMYDRVKFEMHKPDPANDELEFTNPAYAPFVANGERYTAIIDGEVWVNGVRSAFTAYSRASANLQLRFPEHLSLDAGAVSDLALQLNPTVIFKDKLKGVLDPRDGSSQSQIDEGIKVALKVQKK